MQPVQGTFQLWFEPLHHSEWSPKERCFRSISKFRMTYHGSISSLCHKSTWSTISSGFSKGTIFHDVSNSPVNINFQWDQRRWYPFEKTFTIWAFVYWEDMRQQLHLWLQNHEEHGWTWWNAISKRCVNLSESYFKLESRMQCLLIFVLTDANVDERAKHSDLLNSSRASLGNLTDIDK